MSDNTASNFWDAMAAANSIFAGAIAVKGNKIASGANREEVNQYRALANRRKERNFFNGGHKIAGRLNSTQRSQKMNLFGLAGAGIGAAYGEAHGESWWGGLGYSLAGSTLGGAAGIGIGALAGSKRLTRPIKKIISTFNKK